MTKQTVEIHPTLTESRTFPLSRLAKTPAVKWQQYEGDLPAGTLGYGVDCGRSDLVVIDLDCHSEGANGLDAWRIILKENGGSMGDTFSVSTPSGGLHLYYRAPKEIAIRNSAGKLAAGVDVRGKGGYVVGPNSRTKNAEGLESSYDAVREEIIRDLPEWLLTLLVKDKKKAPEPSTTFTVADDFPDNYARKALESAFYTVSTAPSGQRNDTLNREAFGAAKAGAPVERVIADLTRAALSNGLPRGEIDATVRRAAAEGRQKYVPRSITDPTTGDLVATAQDQMEFQQFTKEYYLDLPLGERWAASKNGNLRYVMETSRWLRYDKDQGVWSEVRGSSVREDAASWLRKEYNTAALRNKDSISRNAERCLNKGTADNTIYMGKLHLLISSSDLDTHKDLLVVGNGVVDLRTGKIGPFDRSLLMTKHTPYPYDPSVKSSYWGKVLEVLPEDARDWLQLMTGQTLTGHKPVSDVCIFLFGGGQNGKSTFVDIMAASAGTYGDEPPQSTLMRKTGHGEDFGLIEFRGIRQALIEELPDERNLDVKAIKKLVGTKNLTARGMYRGYETFEVQSTLWISCNRLPSVSETDHGTWRRLLVVPFPYTYKSTASEITEKTHKLADHEVKRNASTGFDTITACLAWRIEGAKRWYEYEALEVDVPPSVKQASLVWRKRSDHILAWAEDMLVADLTRFTLSSDLRDSFNLWLRQHGYSSWGAKLFLERFETTDFFGKSNLVYNPRGTVAKGLRQSIWTAPDGEQRIAGKQPSHVLGVRFRNDGDDDLELASASEESTLEKLADDLELANAADYASYEAHYEKKQAALRSEAPATVASRSPS